MNKPETSTRYEQILALIEQEAQDAIEDGGVNRKEIILVILDGIAEDLNVY